MPDRDNYPELADQSLDVRPPVNIGAELLKGIGLLAAYHFGSMAVEKVSASVGRAVLKGAAEQGPRLAQGIMRATRGFGGTLVPSVGHLVAREVEGFGVLASQVRATKGELATLSDAVIAHPRIAPYAESYAKKVAGPRAALASYHARPGGTGGSWDNRIAALREYWQPAGFQDRILGSSEKYLRRYMGASVGIWATDRALGIFSGHLRQEQGPAWYNIPGQVWDYAKFTAGFLPVDLAFSGILGHGLPLLKAGVEKGATGLAASFLKHRQDFLANQLSVRAAGNPLTIRGMMDHAQAFIHGVGKGYTKFEQRSPIFYVQQATGLRVDPIDTNEAILRAERAFKDAFDVGKKAYRQRLTAIRSRAAKTMSGADFPYRQQALALNDLLNPEKTTGFQAPGDPQGVLGLALRSSKRYLEKPHQGIISRVLGLEPAYIPVPELPGELLHLRRALQQGKTAQEQAAQKFYLGGGVFRTPGAPGTPGSNIIDAQHFRFASLAKQVLQPLEHLKIGIPFIGAKLPAGRILVSPIRTMLDRYTGPFGVMPRIHKFDTGESYLTMSKDRESLPTGQASVFTSDFTTSSPRTGEGDAFFLEGQLIRRTGGQLRNALEGTSYYDPVSGEASLEWFGVDKVRNARIAKLQAQLLGVLPRRLEDLMVVEDESLSARAQRSQTRQTLYEGMKRWAEVGGFARGMSGHVVDFYANAFSRQTPRKILGARGRPGFFSRGMLKRIATGELNAPDVALALNEFETYLTEAQTASYRLLTRTGVQEALEQPGTFHNLEFTVPGPGGSRRVGLKGLMELSDDELVASASHEVETITNMRRGRVGWEKKVRSIIRRYHMDPDEALHQFTTQYPRDLMTAHRADLTGADELRKFLIHEKLFRALGEGSRLERLDAVVDTLRGQKIIGDPDAELLKFVGRGMEYTRMTLPHQGAMDALNPEQYLAAYKPTLEWMEDQSELFQAFGSHYSPLARPRFEAELARGTTEALGTEDTPITLLARHKRGTMPFGRQLFPKAGDPLTTIGAIPFYLMDRFASVGHYLGLAYDPFKRQTPAQVAGFFGKLTVGAAMGIWAWQGLDTFLDVNPMFKNTALDEGSNVFLADQFVRARMALAGVYDVTGVTATARYLEGLMPGSVNSPLSAAVRGIVAPVVGARYGPKGLAVGTAISLFSAGGPLGMFDEWDLTKSREDLQKEYRGDSLVPVRKGRWWELSSDVWTGGKIQYFLPNWYHRLKSQYRYTPTQLGGKLESALYRDIPLLGINPLALLLDPMHFERRHYLDRPYPESSPAFSEVPFIGPLLSSTVGQLVKPTVRMHQSELSASYVDQVGWVSHDVAGVGPNFLNPGQSLYTQQTLIDGTLQARRDAPRSINSMSQTLGSTFYRAFESPMGLVGWEASLVTGDIPLSNTTVYAQSGAVTSHTRQFWDAKMGGMLGTSEFLRRFIPGGTGDREMFNPLRNRMPCLLPDTEVLMASGVCKRAKDVVVGDVLVSKDGKMVKVLDVGEFPTDRVVRIILYGDNIHTLEFSPNHPIYTHGYEFVEAEYVQDGDYVAFPIRPYSAQKRSVDLASFLPPDYPGLTDHYVYYGVQADCAREHEIAEQYTYDTHKIPMETKRRYRKLYDICAYRKRSRRPVQFHRVRRYWAADDFGYLVGVFAAEGSKNRETRSGRTQGFKLAGHDKDKWEHRIEGIFARYEVTYSKQHGDGCSRAWVSHCSPVAMILNLMCPGHASEKRIDATLLSRSTSETLILALIAGMTDGDGYYAKTAEGRIKCGIHTTSKDLAYQYRNLVIDTLQVAPAITGGRNYDHHKAYHVACSGEDANTLAHIAGYNLYTYVPKQNNKKHYSDGKYIFIKVKSVVVTHGHATVIGHHVDGDHTFCVSLMATHNTWLPGGAENTYHLDFRSGDPFSRVAMGELRLPGKGYESAHRINFTYPARASKFGYPIEEQIRFFLGLDSPTSVLEEETMEAGTALHRAIQLQLARANLLVQAESPVYDPQADISGHVDAIVRAGKEKRVLEIKTVSTEKLARLVQAQDPHQSQMNLYLHALGLKHGTVLYVSRENPSDMRAFEYRYDDRRYQKDVARLRTARLAAEQLRKEGYGDATEAYSWLDRAKILSDVAPYSAEAKEALVRAQIQVSRGQYGPEGQAELDEVKRMRQAVARQYDLYPARFTGLNRLLHPSEENLILSENQHIKAAAEYGPIARTVGAAWELLSNRDSWVHRRFLNVYTPEQHYKINVLYGRNQSFWDHPIRDFVEPTERRLLSATDPYSGAVSWALTGATYGGTTFGALSGLAGAVWGTVHGAYRTLSGSPWIPETIERHREFDEYFDKLQYVKAMRLYNQTGDPDWLTVAGETMSGVNPYDQSSKGWTSFYRAMPAKERPYVDAFLKTTDPEKREEIRGLVPPSVREALDARWHQADATAQTRDVVGANALGLTNYFRTHHLPNQQWIGWHPLANLEDIQVQTLDREGLDAHDYNLGWMQQRRRMAHSPYLPGPLDIDASTDTSVFPPGTIGQQEVRRTFEGLLQSLHLSGSVAVTVTPTGTDEHTIIVNVRRDSSAALRKTVGAAF